MEDLSVEEKIELIKSVGEEIVGLDELKSLLESGKELITYDGFEPSGQMHIAQGIQRAINVNKMVKAGFKFKMLVADWFGYLNNKMGGDIEKIKTVGKYFIELWRASGMNLDGVKFIWTSEMVKDSKYWELVMRVAKANSLKRVLKTTQIMGRSENDDLSAAQIFYPCMQTADIFLLGAQVTELGMDQRKVNMLARDVANELGYTKPIVVSHHMLQGLGAPKILYRNYEVDLEEWNHKPIKKDNYLFEYISTDKNFIDQATFKITNSEGKSETFTNGSCLALPITLLGVEISADPYPKRSPRGAVFKLNIKIPLQDRAERAIEIKMSKSIPDSAIFMTDTREDIKRKITKAYCPDGVVEENPILEYCKYIIFEAHHLKGQEDLLKEGFLVKRPEKWGGDIVYKSYEEVEKAFAEKSLSSVDLKGAVIEYIDLILQPVRKHFEEDSNAKEILQQVQSFQVTR